MSSPPSEAQVERRFPPVAWMTTLALSTVIVGGIVMSAYAPRPAPLALVGALLAVAVVLLVAVVVIFTRLRDFAWSSFARVFKWALLAYVIEAGVIEFAFLHDHTSGAALAVLSGMLVVFAVSVPTTIAFTVARYAEPS